ncbi:MAG: L,D-transpeptidase family protein [Azoarcus sp.]|jgi:murein L,D-transpeptidase YafK|nr:L,D-transpeptidase family protein [Azoarcus sp.]
MKQSISRMNFFMFFIKLMITAIMLPLSAPAQAQPTSSADFMTQQQQYARVRNALRNKGEETRRKLDTIGLKSSALNILFVAYKAEAILDVYAKKPEDATYKKLASWPICASSGKLGPKRRQGDKQVPEGFYRIDRFNPASNFHLSLGIDYPNAADKLKKQAADLGGDIFIHGSCVTVGCLPMTDAVIEEIYLYAIYARNSGQKNIPVYIFPFKMTSENMGKYKALYRNNPELPHFWENIKTGYDKFISSGKPVTVNVLQNGDYRFNP